MAFSLFRTTVLAALLGSASLTQAATEVTFWHSMEGPLGERVAQLAQDFNASQSDYAVRAVYKGNYGESMNAGIAAFRAGNAPDILQVFEVGTATMMYAKGAVKPVQALSEAVGDPIDPSAFLGAVAGYYSAPDGKLVSMPFNSSTPVLYYNKDAFKKAGLDPETPAQDLARSRRGREKTARRRDGMRLFLGLAVLGPAGELRRLAQHALCQPGQRLRRAGRPPAARQPPVPQAPGLPGRYGQGRRFHLRRARGCGQRPVHLGKVRHVHGLQRHARLHHQDRRLCLRHQHPALLPRRARRPPELHHRRRLAVGCFPASPIPPTRA